MTKTPYIHTKAGTATNFTTMRDLDDKIKSWYNSYDTHPSWSSFLGFVVRENKKVRNQLIKEVIKIVEKVEKTNKSNGRYNACMEIKSKLKELT
jgi:hypothetical protein